MSVGLGLECCDRAILFNPSANFVDHLQLLLSVLITMGAEELLEISAPGYCSLGLLQLVVEALHWESF